MARTEGDTWDLANSVGATATMVAAARAAATMVAGARTLLAKSHVSPSVRATVSPYDVPAKPP